MTKAPPLVFVYLGNPPPAYSHASMKFAAGGHDGEVILLTNSDHVIPQASRYRVERIESWYDPEPFRSFSDHTVLDAAFMGGFWLHALERFYVLYQYMEKNNLDALFHAELDVMIFDLQDVAEQCDKTGTGIFAVMDDPTRALASLFYVNSTQKFKHFLEFAGADHSMRNEMEMLGRYIQRFPDRGHSLPSSPFFGPSGAPIAPSVVDDRIGLFDGSVFGQWLFGVDPRTVKYAARNRFPSKIANFEIDRLRFRLPFRGRRLTVSMASAPSRQLRTVHIHSKIVRRLTFRPILWFYLWLASLDRSSVVTHQKGWWASRLLDFLLGGKGWIAIRTIGKLFPWLVFSGLIRFARLGAIPMPNRQRARLNSLLPERLRTVRPLEAEEVWVCHLANNTADLEKLLDELEKERPDSKVRVFFHDSAFQPDSVSHLLVESITEVDGASGLESQLAAKIFASDAESILIVDSDSSMALGRSSLDSHGRQMLVVSKSKRDRAEAHTRLFGSKAGIRSELAFAPRPLMMKPAIWREIFDHDTTRLKEWSAMWISKSSQPDIAQLYGAWLWTHKPKLVRLVREP